MGITIRFANATGGLQPKAMAPNKPPINKHCLTFFISKTCQAAFIKNTNDHIIKQIAETIAVQYKAGAAIL